MNIYGINLGMSESDFPIIKVIKNYIFPQFKERDFYVMGLLVLLTLILFPEQRREYIVMLSQGLIGIFLFLMILAGIIFSLVHSFIKRKKTLLEKYVLLSFMGAFGLIFAFLSIANSTWGLTHNVYINLITFLLYVFIFLVPQVVIFIIIILKVHILYALTMILKGSIAKVLKEPYTNEESYAEYLNRSVSDENAGIIEILMATAVVGVFYTITYLTYSQNWGLICIVTLGLTKAVMGLMDRKAPNKIQD